MQQRSNPADRVLCLIDGYLSTGGDGEVTDKVANMARLRRMMHERPGHWCLVGELRYVNRREMLTGADATVLRKQGFEVETVNRKIYARAPHPSGRPLSDLVERKPQARRGDAIPELAPASFGWSRDELSNAIATAHAWLFPESEIQAA